MKHLVGFFLALVTAAALFFGSWGVARLMGASRHGESFTTLSGLVALAAVLSVGLLLGVLLAAPAISPLASGLPGIALLAATALYALSPHRVLAAIPLRAGLASGFVDLLSSGALALLGIAMICPLFVFSRWHGREDEDEDEEGADGGSALPAARGLLS